MSAQAAFFTPPAAEFTPVQVAIPAEDPAGYYAPGDPMADNVDDEAARPAPRAYVAGFDVARIFGLGVRLGYVPERNAFTGHIRGWIGWGAQAYALDMPGEDPGKESLTAFAQAQYARGRNLAGVEAAYSPHKAVHNQVGITGYAATQHPSPDGKLGAGWAVGMGTYNPQTGRLSEPSGARGWGMGGVSGIAAGVRGTVDAGMTVGRTVRSLVGRAFGINSPNNPSTPANPTGPTNP
ncbi:hypothetical protein [Actinomadura sp. HBU206391]|uniref:hypothetical protein n=1 Tax=Actinomadura sp. HBU206391 TaxID=2731692 RepID=UPI00164FA50D|nr:hypothetical protein [Actinomadura sp. HBU206391]MBC6460911.1 hypothetical protein [Actinomadura sp. HBU206391]